MPRASLRSVLLICAFNTARMCRVSTQIAGKPVEISFSKIDKTPVWAQTAATFRDSPHPNAARLFLNWFLEKEQQSKLGTWSPRKDVPPPAGLPPLFSLKLANDYPAFISNTDPVSYTHLTLTEETRQQ